jgi:actin-like ATPase involved in cell morphogenesis
MPSIYWEALDKVVEIYQLREEFNIKISDTEADQIQDNIMKTYQEKTKSSLIEIMVSQFLLDTLLSFTIQVAKNQLLDRLQSIIDSNDPEALLRLIQSHSGELTDESDDPDDDSET